MLTYLGFQVVALLVKSGWQQLDYATLAFEFPDLECVLVTVEFGDGHRTLEPTDSKQTSVIFSVSGDGVLT